MTRAVPIPASQPDDVAAALPGEPGWRAGGTAAGERGQGASSLQRALWGLAATGLVAGLVALALVLSSDDVQQREVSAVFAPLIGWAFIATGLFAWWRRPDNRFGALMTAVGFTWFLGALVAAEPPALFAIGFLFCVLSYGLLFHMLLAFPTGRLPGRWERAVAAIAYVDVTIVQWVIVVFDRTPDTDHCDHCAHNPLLIADKPGLVDAATAVQAAIGIVGFVLLVGLLVRHWRRAGEVQREALTPVLVSTSALAVLLVLTLLADVIGFPPDEAEKAIDIAGLVALLSVPVAFLVGLLRSRLSRAVAVSELVKRLGGPRRRSLRDALADALADPSLDLVYWLPDAERYVDARGNAVELPAPGSGRAATEVERDGARVGAIVHDAALAEERELVRAAGAAAALALENERLDAELHARFEELRASRARLVEISMSERRRLERDLHDGAQQRLVALALQLQLAHGKVLSDPAAASRMLDAASEELRLALDELRELARGIHPAILSDRGLDAALEALAGRASLPVEVEEIPPERLPAAVEAAAYFVVAESLTNVVKYAHAEHAAVRVGRDNGYAVVEVRDDGVGGADPGSGTGLRGLSDRIAALDGRLEIDSPPGGGTLVRAKIPCG